MGFYGQDDFKLTPRVTLNLGLRWEQYNNTFDSPSDRARNPVFQILSGDRQPLYGQQPNLPNHKNFEPRLGLAWDVGGNVKDVVRLSFGLFYIQQVQHATFQQDVAQKPAQSFPEIISNTGIGAGPLASFVYGVTPFPAPQASTTFFPRRREFGGVLVVSKQPPRRADPAMARRVVPRFRGRQRRPLGGLYLYDSAPRLALARYQSAYQRSPAAIGAYQEGLCGDPNLLGPVYIVTDVGEATYNETAVHFEHRFSAKTSFQVNYVLAWSYGQGGNSDGATTLGGYASGAPAPQIGSATGWSLQRAVGMGPGQLLMNGTA